MELRRCKFLLLCDTCDNDLSYWGLSGNTVGITYNDYYNGYLSESDIVFNSNLDWSTADQCPSNCVDVRNAATHEFGHWLRLKDLSLYLDDEKTMYKIAEPGETKKRSLHSDDIEGIRAIYP